MANNMISKDLGPATAYAIAVENGYTGTEEQWASEIANASNNAQIASQKASDAEAYAAGTRGGEAVDSDDPAYQNNAEYYSGEAADSAEAAAGSATSAAESAATASAAYNVNLLAPNYSSSNTYAVGDHVIYNGGYYECISAISTAEAWTAAHWRQVTVGAEAADLKSASIPFPVYPDSKYGTSGQNLRTLGNGKTQWVDQGLPTDEQTAEAVEAWLDEHPEATTTVEDGSITEEKLAVSLAMKAIKDYVTPEMYGAAGDGVTDDSEAIRSAVGEGNRWVILCGTYKVENTIAIPDKTAIIFAKGGKIIADCEDLPLFDMDHVTSVLIRGEGSGDPTISGTCGTAINISGTTDWETSPSNYVKFIEICDINVSSLNIECACAFHKAVKQVHINNCTLYAKNAVISDGKAIEITIDNSVLWCTDENGICVNISSNQGTSRYNEGWNITNCTIDGSGKAFTVSDIFVLQVMNCYIGKNIEIAAPTTTTQTGKISFIGCIIYANLTTIAANSGISYFMRIDNCTFITGRIRLNGNTAFVNISNCAFTFSQSQNGVAIQLQDNVSNVTADNIHIDSTYAGGINVTGTTGGNIRISNVMWDKTTEPVYTERAILCGEIMENKSKWAMITPGTYSDGDAVATVTKWCGQNENGIIIVKARVYEVADDTKTLQIVASGTAVISMPSATGSSSRYILLKSGKNDVMYVCPYYCTTGGTLTITLKANAAVKLDYHGFLAVKRD